MGTKDKIEITPEMIEAASSAVVRVLDALDRERAPVLARAALEAALGIEPNGSPRTKATAAIRQDSVLIALKTDG